MGRSKTPSEAEPQEVRLEVLDAQDQVVQQHSFTLLEESIDHQLSLQPGMKLRLSPSSAGCYATWTMSGIFPSRDSDHGWQLQRQFISSKITTASSSNWCKGKSTGSACQSDCPPSRTNYADRFYSSRLQVIDAGKDGWAYDDRCQHLVARSGSRRSLAVPDSGGDPGRYDGGASRQSAVST